MAGRVYLVGAGPGDAGLITLRGMELLQEADVIVYDRLGAENFLQYARPNCQLIDAGKQPGAHTMKQDGINRLLCRLAKEGKCVVRLKGGDPFLFGRGGEEAAELAIEGLSYEVVPGVSSFYSALAYAGIPVTHRGISASVHVFTGHGSANQELDFQTIAMLKGTLVFLMAMGNLSEICRGLLSYGKNGDTPAAVVGFGTTAKQREIAGTLQNISDIVRQNGIGNPAVVVIGQVALLKHNIGWQKWRPLFGKRILLAGRKETAAKGEKLLRDAGAQVTVWQGIHFVPDKESIRIALSEIHKYQWIFFTSQMAVEVFCNEMKEQCVDVRKLMYSKFFCIGEKTNEALQKYGFYADFVPSCWNSNTATKELQLFLKPQDNVLFPASSLAQKDLENAIQHIGAKCCRITAYETVPVNEFPSALLDSYDAIGFFSPSQAISLWNAAGSVFEHARLFPIGEPTRIALLGLGLWPEQACETPTGLSLAENIFKELSNHAGGRNGL